MRKRLTQAAARPAPARHRAGGPVRHAALAQADLLKYFTAEVRDQNGNPYTQAGGHPFEAFTDINFDTHDERHLPAVPDESVRTVNVDLPAGLVGNPQNMPQCTRAQLDRGLRRRLSGQHPGRGHGAKDRPRPGLRLGRLQHGAARRACRRSSASSP